MLKLYDLAALARPYLELRGKRRASPPVRIPGKAGRAYRAGANLALEGAEFGKRSREDFLGERVREGAGARVGKDAGRGQGRVPGAEGRVSGVGGQGPCSEEIGNRLSCQAAEGYSPGSE